jgi:AcrR family transcriptional regulator/DNA-binding MarR family transcriptional regulator
MAAAGLQRATLAAKGGVRPAVFSPRVQVAEIQRTRLLIAAVSVVDELGYADATVAHITTRARISRRTFYELFDNCEDCLMAVLEGALERLRGEMAEEIGGADLLWLERVRQGLSKILSFLDREPALAQVCVVQASRGSQQMLERRGEALRELAMAIDAGRQESTRRADIPPLMAEGLVGAAHAIVYERLLKRSPEPLTSLLPALMSMIVLPYVGSAAARREQRRPAPHPERRPTVALQEESLDRDWLQGLPMRLTYRTTRVLRAVADRPGISNRLAGEQAGVADQGQISKLLSRLERLGLIANTSAGHAKGEANAWRLTQIGERFTQHIQIDAGDHEQAVA